MKKPLLAMLFVVPLVLANLALAQEPSASVVGRVEDQTNKPVPGATIQVRNVNTNAIRTVQSQGDGQYTVSDLLPGVYEVTITQTGFKELREANLELMVDQTARVDAQLELGAVSETVSVTAQVPLINTESATRGDVITPQEIEQIPLNGRNFDDLAFNVPGVQPAEQGGKGSPYVTNGTRADSSNVFIDGINDESSRDAGAQARPPLDSLQEFKLETSNYSAEYGRLAGSVVTMALKTGGNQLHGSIFEFLRNDLFDARNFFDTSTKSKLRRNQFGGTIDGPVVLPKLYNGHDRTFFLVSWESYREVDGANSIGVVPTPLELQGNFSQSMVKGKAVLLKNPYSSSPCKKAGDAGCFSNNTIPTGTNPSTGQPYLSPIAQNLLTYFKAVNPLAPTPSNFQTNADNGDSWDDFVFKVDQKLTTKDTFSVRALERWETSTNPFSGSGMGNFGSATSRLDSLYGISETRVFTPALINQFNLGLTRTTDNERSNDAGTNWASQLGIMGTTNDPTVEDFPQFKITGFETVGDSATNPIKYTLNSFDLNDVVTWNKGKHSISFGGDILYVQYYQPTNSSFNGAFTFSGKLSGDPFADFLLGLPQSSTLKTGTVTNHLLSTNYSLFVQDDYKILPSLTLNLGVRYELQATPYEEDGQISNYVPQFGQLILAGTVPNLNAILAGAGLTGQVSLASTVGLPQSLVHNDYKDVAPRIGFAWRPFNNNRTVVRAGWGVFYTGSRLSAFRTDFAGGFPFSITQTFTSPSSNPTQVTLSNPFPTALAKDSGVTTANGFDINAVSPYVDSWNLTIERELGKGVAIEAGYIGSKGTHLGRKYDLNQEQIPDSNVSRPYPVFGGIQYYSFESNSEYEASTLTLRKTYNNGLFFRVNYTYGKSIDENSGLNYGGDGGYQGAQNSLNLNGEHGLSNFDRRHVFSADFVYLSPFKKNIFLRGWQIAGSGAIYSGQPFTPQLSVPSQDLGEPTRPNRIASGQLSNPTPQDWFDLTAFQIPTFNNTGTGPAVYGNSGRGILTGPGSLALNLGLSREFHFGEYGLLQFRWETFNFTNHTNFQLPNVHVDTPAAGQITSASDPRIMQFGLVYRF